MDVTDGIGVLRVDRPPMNALTIDMQLEIGRLAREAAERDDIAAVVLSGSERVFAAGADIKEMLPLDQAAMARRVDALQAAFRAVAELPKPTVAAVTGYALGGGLELALLADVRIAADDAKLGLPEITLGVIPGAGGTQRLARLIGPARAKELIFTGRMVEAAEAERIGLVDRVVPASEVHEAARAWAAQFVGGPAQALRAAKEAVNRGLEVDLASGLNVEKAWFLAVFATEDKQRGMQAFADRVKPEFRGR